MYLPQELQNIIYEYINLVPTEKEKINKAIVIEHIKINRWYPYPVTTRFPSDIKNLQKYTTNNEIWFCLTLHEQLLLKINLVNNIIKN